MYHRIGKFQDALKCFTKVLQKIEDDSTVFVARGIVYYDMGNHQLSINDFNSAIKIDLQIQEDKNGEVTRFAQLSQAYYRLGLSKHAQKNHKAAIDDFKKAKNFERDEKDKNSQNFEQNWGIEDGLGCAHHALQNYAQALEHYE